MDRRFIVAWEGPKYLVLQGPFQYPRSTEEPSQATVMTRAMAYRYRDIVGGEVIECQ